MPKPRKLDQPPRARFRVIKIITSDGYKREISLWASWSLILKCSCPVMAMTSATATCGICGDFECFSCLTCNRILAEHDCDCDPVQLACGHRVFRCCSADKLIPTAKKVASTPPARCPDCNQDFNGKNSSLAEVHACQPLREAMQSITCGCRYCRSCAYKPAKK